MRRIIKMMSKLALGMLIVALLGGTSSAMSILPKFGKTVNTVPMKKAKKERTIRCKGEATVDDKGQVTSCSEGFYYDEEMENVEERKMNLKEKFLGWLGNFNGMVFWMVVASIGASMLGFGGVVGTLWTNLFGTATKALKATVRAIARAKRNGGHFMEELDRAHSADSNVQKKINELRAKVDS